MQRISLVAIVLTGLAALSGCTKNAATGHSQGNFLSREEEIQVGTQQMPALIQEYGGVVPDPAAVAYVNEIGHKIAAQVEDQYKNMPWEFTFLNSDVINAFALPGGKVFVSRALVEEMTNEAQLAGVLGHECGHVTAEHADAAIGRRMGLQIGAAAISVVAGQSGSVLAQVAGEVVVNSAGVFMLKYDRAQESEADELGIRYMSRAGYNPMGQVQVMEILKRAAGGGSTPEFMSTHPLPQTRIDDLKKKLSGKKWAAMVNSSSYVYNENEFKTRCLDRLKTLPAPKKSSAAIDWNDPVQWCGLCRERAERGMFERFGVVPQ